jgi:hypothetical protein
MSKVSFSKTTGGNLVTEVVATATPVEGVQVESINTVASPATATALAAPAASVPAVIPASPGVPERAPVFYNDENIDPGDLVIPHMQLVQKVGELSNTFPGGTILFDGKLVLQDGPKGKDPSSPIKILVLGMRPKRFVEKCEGGLRGDMFETEQEVVANNGTLDWNEAQATKGTPNAKRLFQTLLTALVLIEQPIGPNGEPLDANSFPFSFGTNKNYALALYNMKGSAYTNAAKPFMTARKIGALARTGYRGAFWTLSSQLKQFKANYAYVPVVKIAESTDEAFRNTLFSSLGF